MNIPKKIAHIFALIFLAALLSSCSEGCVEPDEFDAQTITIESKPNQIYGSYDPLVGGQRVDWNDYGLRSNGKEFLFQITGSWMSLQGQGAGQADLDYLPRCNICAKQTGVDNCICFSGQTPVAELDPSGNPYTKSTDGITNLDCANSATDQDDALRCTCTQQHGEATDYGIEHFPRDLLNKDQTPKRADFQNNCKYDRGMGAYVALWGVRGVTPPTRVYHLLSQETICNVTLNSQGQCVDKNGNDMTRYVFSSANDRIFMKDDGDGNVGIDLNTGNDVYHSANEFMRTIMYDTYYSDNFGYYNVQILRGVGNEHDSGLLEYLVSLVEDALLGEVNDDGVRDDGIIRFMYLAVVQDSGFIMATQMSLIFYITLFGAAHLWGLVEMNKKEVMTRMLKIALVVFFVSPQSWYFYDTIVVAFFKDSADYLVTMFMSLADANIDPTSSIKIAQMDRVSDVSSATRFSYVDTIIRNLMSSATAKKIAGLLFSDFFGILYIPAIYALIFAFIVVMLIIARNYAILLIKLIFVLSIGPIFMVFTLFSKTSGYFRNWLGYVAGRSFEMIILFIVLYLFLTLIDKNFTEMLYYRVCGEKWGIGPVRITILKTSELNRSLGEWLMYFTTISGLLFVMYDIMDRLPNVVSALFALKIGGESASSGVQTFATGEYAKRAYSAAASAKGAFRNVTGLAAYAAGGLGKKVLSPALSLGADVVTSGLRASGVSGLYNSVTSAMPNGVASGMMNRAFESANAGGGAQGELATRAAFMNAMQDKMRKEPAKMVAMGVDNKTLNKFLDQKLVNDPMKGYIAQAAQDMRALPTGEIPLGKDAEKYVKDRALAMAKDNMTDSSYAKAEELLKGDGMKNLMKNSSALSAHEAAKAFAGNKADEDRYRAHMAQVQANEAKKGEEAKKSPIALGMGRLASNAYHGLMNTNDRNPGRMQDGFEKALDRRKQLDAKERARAKRRESEAHKPWYKRSMGLENPMGSEAQNKRAARRDEISRMTEDARRNTFRSQLRDGKGDKDQQAYYKAELAKMAKNDAYKLATGYSDTRKNREEMLKNFGKDQDRSLFEQAEMLAHLNKLSGHEGEDPREALKKATQDPKDMYGTKLDSEEADKFREAQKDAKTKEAEEKARKDAMGKDHSKDREELVSEIKKAKEELNAVEKASGLVATEFKVEFGASIGDALIKEVDLGLKAGNITLGKKEEGKVDMTKVAGIEAGNKQMQGQIKVAKMGVKMKQMEIDQLKATGGDKDEILALEKEVLKMNNDMSRITSELAKQEAIVKDLMGA